MKDKSEKVRDEQEIVHVKERDGHLNTSILSELCCGSLINNSTKQW